MHLPTPHQLGQGGCTRWRLSEILKFEAAKNGEPTPVIAPEAERYLSDVQVAERFGVSRNTVWRWAREARQ